MQEALKSISNLDKNNEQNKLIGLELIKFALENGADINYNSDGRTPLDNADDKQVIDLLKGYGAKTSNIQALEFEQNGLQEFLWNPMKILEKKYQNLDAEASLEAKMPYIVHHIWLTHPDSPTEIRLQDLENAFHTKEIFAKSSVEWKHVVWTNNKNLIPESVKKLSERGIEVREYQDDIPSFETINNLVDQKKWGMASDMLRYSIVENEGGVYADINYIFNRDTTEEAHKYNFFTSTFDEYYIENYFFGASAHHPVMQKMVELTARNVNNPPEYLNNISNQDSRTITYMGTANPTFIAYYLEANKHGNIDVVK